MMLFKRRENATVDFTPSRKSPSESEAIAKATDAVNRISKRFEAEINSRTKLSEISFCVDSDNFGDDVVAECFMFTSGDSAAKIVAMVNESGARMLDLFSSFVGAKKDIRFTIVYHNEYE